MIPVLRPLLPSAERLLPYLRRIDRVRVYSNHGPLVEELERRLAAQLKLPEGGLMSAASGTAALTGAILATAGQAQPDRPLAVVPAFTFVATAAAVERCGYRAYLVDIDHDTWSLDPRSLAEHRDISRFGVVVPVAPFGRGVPQHPWDAFRRQTGIPVVIDGAASFEALEDHPGRFIGDIPVVLSFHATKSFATGEGGGVVVTDGDLARRVVQALNFGFFGSRDSQSPSLNGKMSEYHAAVGLAELDSWSAKRAALHSVADCYRVLMDRAGLQRCYLVWPDIASCYALFSCKDSFEAERVRSNLLRDRIDFRMWYGSGLHVQHQFADLPRDTLPNTKMIAPSLIGLPVAPDLPQAEISRIAASLASTFASPAKIRRRD